MVDVPNCWVLSVAGHLVQALPVWIFRLVAEFTPALRAAVTPCVVLWLPTHGCPESLSSYPVDATVPLVIQEGGDVMFVDFWLNVPPSFMCDLSSLAQGEICEVHVTASIQTEGDVSCVGGSFVPQLQIGYFEDYNETMLTACGCVDIGPELVHGLQDSTGSHAGSDDRWQSVALSVGMATVDSGIHSSHFHDCTGGRSGQRGGGSGQHDVCGANTHPRLRCHFLFFC